MKTLYLMRHGQTLFNQKRLMQGWCDSPLTELGKKQAKCVKEYFSENNIIFDDAYASSSERACDTLEIVTDLSYQRIKGLKEWNFGIYEGESDDLDPPFPFGDFFKIYGSGESEEEVMERVSTTILEIMKNTRHQNVLMVSHGLSCYCFAKKWEAFQMVSLPKGMPNCVVLKFEFDNDHFSLIEVIDVLKKENLSIAK